MHRIWNQLRYYAERLGCRNRSLLFFDLQIDDLKDLNASSGLRFVEPALGQVNAEQAQGWLSLDECNQALGRGGAILIVAYSDGEFVANCWLETDRCDLRFFDLEESLEASVAYVSHLYVRSDRRGRRIAEQLIGRACQRASELKRRRAVVCCVPENAGVQRVLARMGWRVYLRAKYVSAAWCGLYFVTDVESGQTRAFPSWQKDRMLLTRRRSSIAP